MMPSRSTLRTLVALVAMPLSVTMLTSACDTAGTGDDGTPSTTAGQVVTDLVANGTGGGAPFDGVVNEASDLDDLAETAWGDARLDLHRGHAPVENVLVAYLGISHATMHQYINQGDNLAATTEDLGYSVDGLITSLTNSFVPYIEQGVANGVITQDEVATWTETVREEFTNRVNWEG